MEFGLFQNGYIPGPSAHIPEHEHLMLKREASYPILADKHNWKFAWFGEHHCLTEYSHMSAPEVVMGWVAAQTDYIHLGTAITSLPTTKEHPVRIAERAAMLDHFLRRPFRVRHRPGRGQPRGGHLQRHAHLRDQGHVERGHHRDPPHVGPAGLLLRGRALPGAAQPQHRPQAPQRHPPAAVGGLRQPGHLRGRRQHGHRSDRLQLRARARAQGPHRQLQGGRRGVLRAPRLVHERQRDDDQRPDLPGGPRPGPGDRPDEGPGVPVLDGVPVPRHHPQAGGLAHLARAGP